MRKITAFLVGVVGGAIAGWYATKTYYKEQCEVETKAMRDLCDATMAEAREKVQKATNEAQRAADDRQIFAEALTRLGYVGGSNTTPTPVPEEEKTAHPSEEDNYFSDPEVLGIRINQELQQNEERRKKQPELIDEETYSTDIYSGFEKKEVNWYPEDEVLLDADNGELMDDPYSFLGKDWLRVIEHDGEAYVRNYRWEVDYLILQCAGKGVDNMTISM